MAFYLPLFHSEITGFGDWQTILTLRGMYACFGMGFIFFSILFLRRLRQSAVMNILSLLFGLGFIAAGIYFGREHLTQYQKSVDLPVQMIAMNNEYVAHPRIDIDHYDILLEQAETSISFQSDSRGLPRCVRVPRFQCQA